jgi:gluconate kinase
MARVNSGQCELVLIGGEIGAGKTATAKQLVATTDGCRLLRVRDVLASVLGDAFHDRKRLQTEGAALDQRTGGKWLLRYLDEHCEGDGRWVVDAARTRRQVEPILEARTNSRLVYLAASEATRRHRFALGSGEDRVKRSMPFDEAMRHQTELNAQSIADMAHLVVETDDLGIDQVAQVIAEWCGWTGQLPSK